MIAKQLLYFILTIFTLTSCGNKKSTEEQILSDIFPQLVDSLSIKWSPFPPPPPPPIFDNDSNIIGFDSSEVELISAEYKNNLSRIDSIDSRIIIGITDTCFYIDWNDLKARTYAEDSLIGRFITLYDTEVIATKKLNLNQIADKDGLKIIPISEIEKKYPFIWSMLKDYKFAGKLEFSKIYYLEDNNLGLLQIDYYNDPMNGYSYFIIIEKLNEKWRVIKLLRNWVT